ncbi:transcriptional repressor LexA [Salicibibacter halophilus]|uniref:LexA repressor n=1 Tax=Salicibibacter halophilus TaxID=2502791 RepID=A0A514LE60_9BACI|nr:transcriptional repressor LexA [Salicibibacter halophilus]QDI90130.1 transcriptional repressor LexA [Salicibibacter halophilus]
MKKLSQRQETILEFIKDNVKKKGYPPSVREIGEAVDLASSSTVHGHLARLEKKGYIRRDPTKPRAIEVLHLDEEGNEIAETDKPASAYVPLIGKVTAGLPITAVENVEGYMPLPDHFVGSDQVFMLTIEGDSMIEAGILDGDQVIVRQQPTANNGDIIVAMTDEQEATVKRFYNEGDHIRLQPENQTMEPIILDDCQVLGKISGVFRTIS